MTSPVVPQRVTDIGVQFHCGLRITTAGATTPAGEVNALTDNITAGTAMPGGAVSAVTGITPDTPGDDTSEESDNIPSEDSGQFRRR